VAFLRYLPQRGEAALTSAYDLGRTALATQVSLLHVAQLHHEVLSQVLDDTPPEQVREVATAASEFLLEVLATFDMAQRGLFAGDPDADTDSA
jgi:hypothetical protein